MSSSPADRQPQPERSTGKDPEPLAQEAKQILRAAMERRGYTYKDLAEALSTAADGQNESVQALINKVNRGRFSFAFFLRACRVMDVQTVDVTIRPSKPKLDTIRTRHMPGSNS